MRFHQRSNSKTIVGTFVLFIAGNLRLPRHESRLLTVKIQDESCSHKDHDDQEELVQGVDHVLVWFKIIACDMKRRVVVRYRLYEVEDHQDDCLYTRRMPFAS